MAEGKVNRNNHPILVEARKEAYSEGRRDGFDEGYKKGYSNRNDSLVEYHKAIVYALEKKAAVLQHKLSTLQSEGSAYSQGYREGFRAAKEDIRYTVNEMQRMMDGILGEVDD
jgi:flagellar biosynthesis/type III secretory pathway protein FliH